MRADDGEAPEFEAERDRVLDELVTFVRVLRRAGVVVPTDASILAARALAAVGFDDRERVRAALRAAIVSDHDDVDTYERFFPEFWHRLTDTEPPDLYLPGQDDTVPSEGVPLVDEPGAGAEPAPGDREGPDDVESAFDRVVSRSVAVEGGDDAGGDEDGDGVTSSVYSPTGQPERVSAEALGPGVGGDLPGALRTLETGLATLRGRRWQRSGDERLDTRRALRRSFATGGTVLAVPQRERKRSAVKAVFLVDVSQSVLDVIDRSFLVRFLRLARSEWRDVRVFFFDTDVAEVTDAFDAPTPEGALESLERAEAAWGGGTRIGHAVAEVRRGHPDAVDRDTVVFVVSDGLEVGELDVLEEGMAWLSRGARAVLWLNPLAASVEYEPTCRGMEVSLPYLDGLFAFTKPADVAELGRQLARRGIGGRLGYEHDPRRIRATRAES